MREVVDDVLACIACLGTPGKVDAHDDGTALHEAPRGDGAVDAAGDEAHDLAGRPHGKPADTALGARVDVDAALDDVDVYLDVRVFHLDLLVGRERAQVRADQLVELHRVDGIVGVGTAGIDLEGLVGPAVHEGELRGLAILLGLAGAPPTGRHARHPGDLQQDA